MWGGKNSSISTFDQPLPQGAYADEYAHLLFYKHDVIAAVIETRTPYNYVHFDFFQNSKNLEELLEEEKSSKSNNF